MIQWRVDSGHWVAMHRSVYRLTGAPSSWRQSLLAACLAAGTMAVASHRSAGALWGLEGLKAAPLELTIPADCRAPRMAPVTVHRSRSHRPSAGTTLDAIPVTSAARTIVDLASVLDEHSLEIAVDSALREGLVSVPHLRRYVTSLGTVGRCGAAALGGVLTDRSRNRPAESGRELRLARLLVAVGLPAPARQYELREDGVLLARFDLAYPPQRIAAEYDSYRYHSGRQAWYRDKARYNRVAALDWLVFPMTEANLLDPARATALEVAKAYRLRFSSLTEGVCS